MATESASGDTESPTQPTTDLKSIRRDPHLTFTVPTAADVTRHVRHGLVEAGRHGKDFVSHFRKINFKREVWPLDAAAARKLGGEPAFWAVILLAVLPLFIFTLSEPGQQLVAFATYFAVIWGLIFRFSVVPGVKVGWGWLAAMFLFSGTVGLFLAGGIERALPDLTSIGSSSITKLFGFVSVVGVCEEVCKMLPVIVVGLLLRRRLSYGDLVMLGVFSGLGFAAFENVGYFKLPADDGFSNIMAAVNDPDATVSTLHAILVDTAQTAMSLAMMRTISLTFGHAVWAGIFAHFLAQGRGAGVKRIPLWAVGLAVAAVLHGTYDWFWFVQPTLAVGAAVLSFMLFKLYVAHGVNSVAGPNPIQPVTDLRPASA